MKVALSEITVTDRLRALDPKVVKELAESMEGQGQLQPIVLRPRPSGKEGYRLVAGRHRLEAAKSLKWADIEAKVFKDMEADEAQLGEIDENLVRANLSAAEEAMHLKRRKDLYEKLFPETKKGGDPKTKVQSGKKSFSKDTAEKTGKDKRTVQRAVKRGKKGKDWLPEIRKTSLDKKDEIDALIELDKVAPQERAKLVKEAKAGEKVSARTRLKQVRREEREAELGKKQKALPKAEFGVIVADPPWDPETWSEKGKSRHPSNHYPTQSKEILKALPVHKIAAKDCVLWLWTTAPFLKIAIDVMERWGFEYKSNYVWIKNKAGTGYWNRNMHEVLLIGTKGKIPAPAPGTQKNSVITAPVGKHSAKPEEVLKMIEKYYPTLPKIELHRRGPARKGWSAWGNEVESEKKK